MESSEDELIAAIRRAVGTGPGVEVGIGDDAAVVEAGRGSLVLTTDALIEGVHFSRGSMSARDLGYRAVVVAVSDLAAMAASPRYALASLAAPKDVDAAWVVDVAGGMRAACEEYALVLVGGNLSGASEVSVTIFVAGEVAPGRAVLRSGARPGDVLAVTGTLGAAAGGVVVEGAADPALLGSEWARTLVHAHQRPIARVGEGQTLAAEGAHAMMDVSDGLALDLTRLCRASGVGAEIDIAAVPASPELEPLARREGVVPVALALGGGEDYELIVAIDPGRLDGAVRTLGDRFGTPLTAIGRVTEGEIVATWPDGERRPLEPAGWDHFG